MLQPATTSGASSPLMLSPEDVDRLLNDTTSGTRVDMTHKIGAAYAKRALNEKEVMVGEQIFRLLLRDTEVKVRSTLAQHVKDSVAIPRDIVLTLARDVEEVALPVLQYSQVLSDGDLVELIESTEQVSRYLAISSRPRVSGTVSDMLLGKGNEAVTVALVNNVGAEISESGYDKIITVHSGNEALMQSLSARPYLPVAAVDKMLTVVSGALADTLKKKYKVPPEEIDREVEKTREKETLGLVRLAAGDAEAQKLIDQLYGFNRLTPTLILSALCQGNFEFFEMALAKLSDLPVANARKLINDRGDLGFRAIYNKSGLPEAMFPAVKLLLKIVRELNEEGEKLGSARFANHVVERILHHSEDASIENLSYIIALVRRVAQN